TEIYPLSLHDALPILASTLLGLWYAWFIHYNRRRAADVLQWVQAACLGKGRVADLRWQASSSRLKASLHLSSRWFEDAHLTIRRSEEHTSELQSRGHL